MTNALFPWLNSTNSEFVTTTTATTEPANDAPPTITLAELNYLVKCGKKDKRLAAILVHIIDDVTVEVEF